MYLFNKVKVFGLWKEFSHSAEMEQVIPSDLYRGRGNGMQALYTADQQYIKKTARFFGETILGCLQKFVSIFCHRVIFIW